MPAHRILFLDAYDSFSNSIIALLRAELPVDVECIKIDDPRFILNDEAFFDYLDGFDAVVAGPGPGHPMNAEDVGLIEKLWELPEEHLLPVLGVCLGFQSLCLSAGANVGRLREPRHGIMTMITHRGKDVFAAAGKIVATQYHSLHVQLEGGTGETWEPSQLWEPSAQCPDLMPLAWDLLNVVNGPVLMATRHCSKPFWGVQYHPESICTNKEGRRLIAKWWEHAANWELRKRRVSQLLEKSEVSQSNHGTLKAETLQSLPGRHVKWATVSGTSLPSVNSLVDILRNNDAVEEPLLLESGIRNGKPVNPETGRFSIIGLSETSSMQIQYFTNDCSLQVLHDSELAVREIVPIHQAFSYIGDHMRSQKAFDGPAESPFWGGLIGSISYEAGLTTIDVTPSRSRQDRPDMWFVFVERSVVVDHVTGLAYVQSIRVDDDNWVHTTQQTLQQLFEADSPPISAIPNVAALLVDGPQQEEYCEKVRECQSKLRAGESYELCLTDQSTIQTPADPWSLYTQLRSKNPAPFGAYLRFQSPNTTGLSIAGSSPERFLSWSRSGKCQFRPIKGTVKKSPGVTRAKAEEILGTAKERAENLMIVDLIRHDLAGVPDVEEVRVPTLMSIEEYETVFQLVSVIEGEATSGIAALTASLPPGSMTGAPKKRSCELLKEIESGQPRGLYSGVLGYFDVGGGGDFSVVIRTAFKWDDEGDRWRIGAGGAITALSEAGAEWEEMVAKRESVLNSLA